jgi:hypothetical protein
MAPNLSGTLQNEWRLTYLELCTNGGTYPIWNSVQMVAPNLSGTLQNEWRLTYLELCTERVAPNLSGTLYRMSSA